ncbi:MAPEG family protein [Tritonibacter horizontis]|uniref:Inner membrane protein YecN n=1 Tax=Tritonibacter horizontis TaxID=1768241 RepID=A0A132C1X1_9RHOB|nr:MAPEG family protein [Tritonibacter horizontis]KUP94574.1 inner membrane protein YecN [Tritonibacter horizontis]
MTLISVTPFYAAAIAILMAVLSTWTGIMRGKTGVALGDGGNSAMALAIRRFGNLSEYAAMAILLLLLMEMRGVDGRYLHAYGIALLMLRIIHPAVLFDNLTAPMWKKAGRFVSAAGTALLLVIGAAALLIW